MKMKHTTILALLTALLLTACAPTVRNPAKDTTPPTVADIFNESTEAVEPPQTTSAVEETEGAAPQTVLVGSIGLGFGDEVSTDEKGSYRIYSGGEMILPVKLTTSGTIAERGIGMLLFVDGKPQPYKTEAEPEYAYLHTFFQGQGPKVYDLSFTPITGQTGEVLELYIATVLSPTYSLSEGMIGMVYTSGSMNVSLRLKYEQTPPEEVFLENQLSLSNTTVSFVDTEAADIQGWSNDDLRERISYTIDINGIDETRQRVVHEVSADTPVNLRYEVWGSPYVDFGLVIYVDNVPVFDSDVGDLMLDIQNGQTTVVETQLNLDQFDGESVVYAVLVPRNYRTNEVMTSAGLTCTKPIFLIAETAQ